VAWLVLQAPPEAVLLPVACGVAGEDRTGVAARITRPAPLGKRGCLLLMGIPLVRKELALVCERSSLERAAWCPSAGGFRDRIYSLVGLGCVWRTPARPEILCLVGLPGEARALRVSSSLSLRMNSQIQSAYALRERSGFCLGWLPSPEPCCLACSLLPPQHPQFLTGSR